MRKMETPEMVYIMEHMYGLIDELALAYEEGKFDDRWFDAASNVAENWININK